MFSPTRKLRARNSLPVSYIKSYSRSRAVLQYSAKVDMAIRPIGWLLSNVRPIGQLISSKHVFFLSIYMMYGSSSPAMVCRCVPARATGTTAANQNGTAYRYHWLLPHGPSDFTGNIWGNRHYRTGTIEVSTVRARHFCRALEAPCLMRAHLHPSRPW